MMHTEVALASYSGLFIKGTSIHFHLSLVSNGEIHRERKYLIRSPLRGLGGTSILIGLPGTVGIPE